MGKPNRIRFYNTKFFRNMIKKCMKALWQRSGAAKPSRKAERFNAISRARRIAADATGAGEAWREENGL